MGKDALGQAVHDYFHKQVKGKLITRADEIDDDELPLDTLFRNESELIPIEKKAISLAKGRILDVGAGSGAHSVILKEKGFDVTALDISPLAVKTMEERGLKAICTDIYEFKPEQKYDTIYLFMNGIGICGDINDLPSLLTHLMSLLTDNGQLIFDTSDLRYLYEDENGELIEDIELNRYYGQFKFQMEYNGLKTDWFDWVYIDPTTLDSCCHHLGLKFEVIDEGENYHYLCRITKS